MTTEATLAPARSAVPIERSTGMRCAYRMSITTQMSAVRICCRKLMVVRSMWPLRVIEACTAVRSSRDSTSAARTKISR